MKASKNFLFVLAAVLATFECPGMVRGGEPCTVPVIISLNPTTSTTNRLVRLDDIADVSGGDNMELRDRIRRLDIVALSPGGRRETVSRQQIDLRLRLAGIPDDTYRIRGADRVVVDNEPVNDDAIRTAISESLAERMGVSAEDIEVRFTRPVPALPAFGRSGDVQIRPQLPDNLGTGRMRVDVGLFIDGRLQMTFNVSIQAKVYAMVANATQRINQSDTFTERNVSYERRALTLTALHRVARDPLGKTSARAIPPGRMVGAIDVVEHEGSRDTVLINRRDVVRLIARKGSLKVVVPAAEALQDGKAGDLIKVRNIQSNRIVTGRVVNRSEVEVPL